MDATSSTRVSRDPLVFVTFLPFQFAYSTHNTRYFWWQVYISSDGERVTCPCSLSCGEIVFNVYFWDLTHHCDQVPLSVWNTSFLVCFSHCLGSGCGHCHDCGTWTALVVSLFHSREHLPPFLVGHYGAHATASHAQDCPDWKLEKTLFSYSNCINVFISGNTFLWCWSGVIIVLMLRHHTHTRLSWLGSGENRLFPITLVIKIN